MDRIASHNNSESQGTVGLVNVPFKKVINIIKHI